ncbi:Flp pilus assembly protein TadG [Arthrobacter sp. ok909]|uniref:TadE/TadG family type IV pilus assembly protein n=1 Tax=Arthrobacter sp. ok909 TaxID=1761746 RepID=UPI000881EAA2|nr:TadE/TadG family type IV pilus assembly protein [Arthrobacter sp. ok909]SDP37734.1 Flp pilus assembly protein TadG [Arthrobacter sp. ok909]
MTRRRRAAGRPGSLKEKGAVAVEFALVLPIFLVLVLGIVEFSRAFNIQVSLSEAARETARYTAIHYADASFSTATAQGVGVSAAPSVALAPGNINISYSGGSACAAGDSVIVTVNFATPYMTGFPALIPGMPASLNISSKGVMRCGG